MLGWGSNLLAVDADLDLAVLSLAPGEPYLVEQAACCAGQTGEQVTVRASGGLMLPKLVNWVAKLGLSGLEGLAGIPGTVGGAVAMNAGSYGRETAEVLARVRIWDPAGGLRWIGPAQWETRVPRLRSAGGYAALADSGSRAGPCGRHARSRARGSRRQPGPEEGPPSP